MQRVPRYSSRAFPFLPALFFGLLLSADPSRSAEPFVHRPTGVALPAEVVGFARGEVMDYEKDSPGQGDGVAYRKPGAYSAKLYIYTTEMQPFPTSGEDPRIAEIRRLGVESVLERAKTREPTVMSANSRHTGNGTANISGTPVLVDNFIVYVSGLATNDVMCIWLAKGHIWKLRVTREADVSETWVAFLRELVALSIAPASTPSIQT
jgi:hypothetical protein